MGGRFLVGTSGWDYPHWKDGLFAGVPRGSWLRHYAGCWPTRSRSWSWSRARARERFAFQDAGGLARLWPGRE